MRRITQYLFLLPRLLIHINMLLRYMYRTNLKETVLTDNFRAYIMKMIIIISK